MTDLFLPINKCTKFSKLAELGKAAPPFALRVGLFIPKFRFAVFD